MSPFLRVTIAFFQSLVQPRALVFLRRSLPGMFEVLTLTTLTLNRASTARLIWGALARLVGHDRVLIESLRLQGPLLGDPDGLDDVERSHGVTWRGVVRPVRRRRG